MEEVYDVLIIGSGPAGLTAALYSARYARKTCVISEGDGGTAGKAGEVENWPGTKHASGSELMHKMREHVNDYDVDFVQKQVKSVEKKDDLFVVDVGDSKIKSKTIIFALGTRHRHLEIPGEKELVGKGVSYCATCDGMFFKDKDVVVIGGADSAAKAALYLSEVAKSVKMIYRKSKLRSEAVYSKRIEKRENIKVIYDAIPVSIMGKDKVEGVKIKMGKSESDIPCNGFFIEIGAHPCNELSSKLGAECDNNGYTKVDRAMKTNIEGVFAAGDMTNNTLKQIITASAEGATAANSAQELLQRN